MKVLYGKIIGNYRENSIFYFYYYYYSGIPSAGYVEQFSYFGGRDVNCCIFVDRNDLIKKDSQHPDSKSGFRITPFIYENEDAFEDMSLMGQPVFSNLSYGNLLTRRRLIPFFDLEIFDYEFYYDEVRNLQFLKINLNKKVNIAAEYLGVIFGLEKFNNNRPFSMTIDSDVDGYVFTVRKIDNGDGFLHFNYNNSYKDGAPNREFHRLYLSPYGASALDFNEDMVRFSSQTLSYLTFGKVGDSSEPYENEGPSRVVINDVFGAKGYNENTYTLVGVGGTSSVQSIFWKRKNISYQASFEIPADHYGGIYGNWGATNLVFKI
jgi:hypothetical protein